jgi:hypothetical protein
MFIQRCRPEYSPEELAEVYAEPWSFNPEWEDHILRREATVEMMNRHLQPGLTVADLSCGDGYLAEQRPDLIWTLGDYAPGWPVTGPIELTLPEIPTQDVLVSTETLEHLNDPSSFLRAARLKASRLLLTTPLKNEYDDNPEHYYAWDDEAIGVMLEESGWRPVDFAKTNPPFGYVFQIWMCA